VIAASAKMGAVFQSGYHDLVVAPRKAAPGEDVTSIYPSRY
jgi:hypothetical protein